MKLPTINLNGTSPSDLLEQQAEVLLSMRVALDKLYLAAPHGRDHLNGDWSVAKQEHFARINKIRDVMVEVEIIAEHCSDAVNARKRLTTK